MFLFVYGTLREGGRLPGRPRIEDSVVSRKSAVVSGVLYDIGDYPGLKPGVGEVVGELLEIRDSDSEKILESLDRFEKTEGDNPEYRRETVWVDGKQAWIYYYSWETREDERILSGDWFDKE